MAIFAQRCFSTRRFFVTTNSLCCTLNLFPTADRLFSSLSAGALQCHSFTQLSQAIPHSSMLGTISFSRPLVRLLQVGRVLYFYPQLKSHFTMSRSSHLTVSDASHTRGGLVAKCDRGTRIEPRGYQHNQELVLQARQASHLLAQWTSRIRKISIGTNPRRTLCTQQALWAASSFSKALAIAVAWAVSFLHLRIRSRLVCQCQGMMASIATPRNPNDNFTTISTS